MNPSAYQKILQVAETMKQERRKCKRSEANESSYESESSLDMTDKVGLSQENYFDILTLVGGGSHNRRAWTRCFRVQA